ncbi:MAG: nuclease-related domain-containing protein [Gaiellaceae bacterium]
MLETSLKRGSGRYRESFGVSHPRLHRKEPYEAGKAAFTKFRLEREKAIRREWRTWVVLAMLSLGAAAAVGFTAGTLRVVSSFVLGVLITSALFAWEMGGNARNLKWLWGSIGERQTEELLRSLDDSWECVHDIPCRKGNWDHVLVSPAGVFLLDSKSYSSASEAKNDELRSGRLRCRGSEIRSFAATLKEALEPKVGKQWVSAAVVIWGEFRQKRHEENKVTYLQSDELLGWLREQPGRLSERERKTIANAVRELKEVSKA